MSYLQRKIDNELLRWKNMEHRKVVLLRGARQVGKSSAVRELGKTSFLWCWTHQVAVYVSVFL